MTRIKCQDPNHMPPSQSPVLLQNEEKILSGVASPLPNGRWDGKVGWFEIISGGQCFHGQSAGGDCRPGEKLQR